MRPVRCPRATYQRHQPERTVLYRTIATHLPTFFARPAGEDGTGGWPAFVRREFEAYLKCGVPRAWLYAASVHALCGRAMLTLPYRLRYRLAWDHALCRAVLGVYARALLAFYARVARAHGIRDGQSGMVTVI